MITLKNKIFSHPRTLAFGLGTASVAALPPFYVLPILFVTFSSLLLLINQAENAKKAFTLGYWFGFGYFACNLSWIGNALLLDPQRLGWLYPITLLASGGFFGLFVAFPAYLSRKTPNFYTKWLAFSSWWVMFEWLRSFIFTGFPWNLLGSTLAFSNIAIQPAALIGTYGLSLIVLLTASAPALILEYKNRNAVLVTAVTVILLPTFVFTYGNMRFVPYQEPQNGITVRLVQPSIPQDMKWNQKALKENFQKYIDLSQSPGLNNVDFVIWGETAAPYPLDFDLMQMQKATEAVPEKGYLLTGLVRYEYQDNDYHPVNSMFAIDKQGNISGYYDKSHLVPFGEYIPFRKFLPNWITPITNTISDFIPGKGPQTIRLNGYPAFGTLICYEVIFPAQIINPQDKPDWLLNLTNDGWYGDSQGPYQHLVTSRLRAVEEGKTLVRSANTGISAVISPYGEIIDSIPLNKIAVLDVKLPESLSVNTVYGQFGNIIPIILCIINIIFSLVILLPFF